MAENIYIRMRQRIKARLGDKLLLTDVAQIVADNQCYQRLANMEIYQIRKEDKQLVVIDVMQVIKMITTKFQSLDVQTMGPVQTIIEVKETRKKPSILFFILTWFLLFVGSGLAILNFHEDVSMGSVHQKLYWMITGKEEPYPILLQIPYSLGIGIGMILFFNHLFKKKINEEPSPLEIEVFKYQQSINDYVSISENKEVTRDLDRD